MIIQKSCKSSKDWVEGMESCSNHKNQLCSLFHRENPLKLNQKKCVKPNVFAIIICQHHIIINNIHSGHNTTTYFKQNGMPTIILSLKCLNVNRKKPHLNVNCTTIIAIYIHYNLRNQTHSVSKSKSQHHDFIWSNAIVHGWRGKSQHTYKENAKKPTRTTIMSKAKQNRGNTSQSNQHSANKVKAVTSR